jgi:hypothetical protein
VAGGIVRVLVLEGLWMPDRDVRTRRLPFRYWQFAHLRAQIPKSRTRTSTISCSPPPGS